MDCFDSFPLPCAALSCFKTQKLQFNTFNLSIFSPPTQSWLSASIYQCLWLESRAPGQASPSNLSNAGTRTLAGGPAPAARPLPRACVCWWERNPTIRGHKTKSLAKNGVVFVVNTYTCLFFVKRGQEALPTIKSDLIKGSSDEFQQTWFRKE